MCATTKSGTLKEHSIPDGVFLRSGQHHKLSFFISYDQQN
jgi:hypothetical protein